MRTIFEEYGAAVIALIVAAILMVALGVYNVTNGEGTGISKTAGESTSKTVDSYKKQFFDTKDNRNGIKNSVKYVSKAESQVGKYADIDGDGTVDGIIFADLLFGESGKWNDSESYCWDASYTIPTISSCKDYYISQESYTDKLGGTSDVLSPVSEGNDRFYVMSLTNVDENYHNWYSSKSDYGVGTIDILKEDFGSGKDNTSEMIKKWDEAGHDDQSTIKYTDIWNEIQTESKNGWFVPSKGEWCAFAVNMNITKDNYSSKNLGATYWSSSVRTPFNDLPATPSFVLNGVLISSCVNDCYLRLATTF